MHAPNMGCPGKGEFQNVSQCMIIDTRGHRGHQHHRQTDSLTIIDGFQLGFQQICTPKRAIDLVIQSIKL